MPAQSRVIVNIWVIGREPINWTEPERFYPERFLDRSMDYKGIDFKFIPFGAGTLFAVTRITSHHSAKPCGEEVSTSPQEAPLLLFPHVVSGGSHLHLQKENNVKKF
ncbi:hypothetical protein D5086_003190 [Populus alba]|uniref:Uncharacterized protein n=1 Tax=Populus alba TaxID=43335 RepID=A0ACC4D3V6_POPAL